MFAIWWIQRAETREAGVVLRVVSVTWRRAAGSLGVACLAGGALVVPVADGSAANPSGVEHGPGQVISGQLVLDRHVPREHRGALRSAVNGGSAVTLTAWRASSRLGESPAIAVGKTRSDETGRFGFEAAPTAELLEAGKANDGYVNFLVEAVVDGQWQPQSFSRRWNGQHWVSREDGQPESVSVPVRWRAGPRSSKAAGGSVGPALAPPNASSATALRHGTRKLRTGSDSDVPPCAWHTYDEGDLDTGVGLLSVGQDSTGTFTYGETADSDISVMAALNNGPFQISGTAHMGTKRAGEISITRSAPRGSAGISQGASSRFHYEWRKFRAVWECDGPMTGEEVHWMIVPTKWVGGADLDCCFHEGRTQACDSAPYSSYRDRYISGSTFETSNTRSGTLKWAILSATSFGEATSGYSKYVKLKWSFGSQVTYHYLCGKEARPLDGAKFIYAS